MQGSFDIQTGYSQYSTSVSSVVFAGSDSENDSAPTTDWAECQANAHAGFLADTVLSAPGGAYGSFSDWMIKGVDYDNYGSRFASEMLGWRLKATITNQWKSNGQIFNLVMSGARVKTYNTGPSTWIQGGEWNDSGRMFFQYSEDPNLYTSGADILSSFGDYDFKVDVVQLNNSQRAGGKLPWTALWASHPITVNLDADFIQNMTGNDLYIWMMVPYFYEPFYCPAVWQSTVYWKIYFGNLLTYY